MTNHFTAMGLPVREREDLSRVIGAALRGASVEPAGFRQTLAVWREPAGAGLDVLLRKARLLGEPTVECATPQFDGASRQSVRVTGVVDDGDCGGCALLTVELLEDGEMLYPLALAPARVVSLRKWFAGLAASREPVEASIVFVAEDLTVHADEAAFHATQTEPGFAAESVIPVGLFSEEAPPAPAALVHGVVTATRTIQAAVPYQHLTVRTLGGEFDVVTEETDVAVGNVVAVQAWVCGRIGELA
jgi:hypothetical protein